VKHIPEDVRREYPDVEWKMIAGMRDKLIHEYFGVDYEVVWDIVSNEIPRLNTKIGNVLKEL